MSTIFLLIPETALRDAVAEQIRACQIGTPQIVDSVQSWLKQPPSEKPAILIVEGTGSDKNTAILLQALNEGSDKPVILTLGGIDDVEGVTENFTKPFRLGHLMSRLRYYLETAPLLRDATVTFGPYKLEPHNRRILANTGNEPIRLTEKETALLVFLTQNKQPATRKDILAAVWGYDERIDTHTLETHIYQLRRKLDQGSDSWLISEAGTYRLAMEQT